MINTPPYIKYLLQAAIFCSCLFILGCENDEREINALTNKQIMVEEAKKIDVLFSQQGQLRARLKAPLMLRYQ
ncbi:MAG TPA: LPS export ABC transporter periplasmic protein LptC, partial [Flavisolibacter sp.]|nr:LPS export ABC transporter periplasmic protein LptC [Flavisolibacter sp.]